MNTSALESAIDKLLNQGQELEDFMYKYVPLLEAMNDREFVDAIKEHAKADPRLNRYIDWNKFVDRQLRNRYYAKAICS